MKKLNAKESAMFKFLKVLVKNILQGPATEAFPLQPAKTPDRFRGRVTLNPDLCVGCGICSHVCSGDAIRIIPNEEKTGYHYTVWYNSCCLCGSCTYYCPTKAITMTNNWHNSHKQEDKFKMAEHHFIPYLKCDGCGAPIRLLPPHLATRIYAHSPVDIEKIIRLCPSCRQIATAERQGELHESNSE